MKAARLRIGLLGRLLFVVTLLATSFVFAMFQGGIVSWTIFYILLPFVGYSILLFFYPISSIKVERELMPPRVHRGGSLMVVVRLKRKFRFPLLYVVAAEMGDDSRLHASAGSRMKQIFLLGISKEVEWTYTIDRMPRGEHKFRGIEIELSDFFGWIKKTALLHLPETILVYPKITDFQYNPRDSRSETGSLDTSQNSKDLTLVTGVRDYQAGDRMAWIHWKSFAKTQNLMTKEFDGGRAKHLFLVLDGRYSDVFEGQVELAASLLRETSRRQSGLAFAILGSNPLLLPSIQSEDQLHQAFVQLAKLQPSNEEGLPVVELAALPSSENVVIITGNPDEILFESLLSHFQQARSIVCFVIVDQEGLSGKREGAIQLARSKGVKVHMLYRKPSSDTFNEVAR